MGSLIQIRSCANTLSRSYTMISTLKYMRNLLRHFSLSTKICFPTKQWGDVQVSRHCAISSGSCIFVRIDSARYFSMTYVLAKSKDRGKDKKKQKAQHIDYNEMGQVVDVNKLTSLCEKAFEQLKDNFVKYLTVRSNIGAIEDLSVKFEGKDYTLQELSQISRKPKLIVLNASVFPQAIPDILKSLTKNQMNLNPQQDGTTIYIPIPKVTKEHREMLSKNAKSFYVKYCDNVREIRNKHIKIVKQKEELAKDLIFRVEGYIDALCHEYISKAEQLLETKQKELLGDPE